MGRPAPTYWWDFDGEWIVVQGSYSGGDRLAEFPIVNGQGDAAIAAAEELIQDYEAGRRTPLWGRTLPLT